MSEDTKGYFASLVIAIPILIWLMYTVVMAFRNGQIAARGDIHERHQHPFYFWFYVVAYGSMALAIIVLATIAVANFTIP